MEVWGPWLPCLEGTLATWAAAAQLGPHSYLAPQEGAGQGAPLVPVPPFTVRQGAQEQEDLAKVKVGRSRLGLDFPSGMQTPTVLQTSLRRGHLPQGALPPVQPRPPGCLSWDPWLSPPAPSPTWEEAIAGDPWILRSHQYCTRRSLCSLGPQLPAAVRGAKPAPGSKRHLAWWLAPPAARCSLRETRERSQS